MQWHNTTCICIRSSKKKKRINMAENEICVREDKVKILPLDAEEKPKEDN